MNAFEQFFNFSGVMSGIIAIVVDLLPLLMLIVGAIVLMRILGYLMDLIKPLFTNVFHWQEDSFQFVRKGLLEIVFFIGLGLALHTIHGIKAYSLFYLIILLTILAARLLNEIFIKLEHTNIPTIRLHLDHFKFFKHIIIGAVYFVGFLFAISTMPDLKAVAFSLLASSGILVTIAGFASQNSFANIVSGIFIEVFNPFSIGDRITFKDVKGDVDDITLRHTIIKTLESKYVVVPNSLISADVISNVIKPDQPVFVPINVYVDYSADLDKALVVMKEVLASFPEYLDTRSNLEIEYGQQAIFASVYQMQPKFVQLYGWAWVKNDDVSYVYSSKVYAAIKKRFDQAGISFPKFSQN